VYSRDRLNYIGYTRASWSRQNGRTKLVIRRSERELQGRIERLAALVGLRAAKKLPIRDDGRRNLVDDETSTAAAVAVEISGD
jgi:hypothetical protein